MPITNDHEVLILTNYWKGSPGGGIRTFLVHLAEEFERTDVKFQVLYREGEDPSNIKIGGNKYLFPLRALLLFGKLRPAAIHAQGEWYCLLPGYLYMRIRGARLIFTAHTVLENPSLLERWTMRFLMERCDVVSFVSLYMKQHYDEVYGLSGENSVVIYPGVEQGAMISEGEARSFKERYDIGADQIVLLGQGLTAHHVKYEGAKKLILALKLLINSYPNVLLVLSRDGLYVPRLKEFVKDQGVDDRVRFVGDQDNPLIALQACDIFTHITLNEGLSLALLEAMSLGKPIVASRVGGIPEVIGDEGGLLVGGDPEEIARGIESLIRDRALAQRMGEKAKSRAQNQFNWNRTALTFRSYYFPNQGRP